MVSHRDGDAGGMVLRLRRPPRFFSPYASRWIRSSMKNVNYLDYILFVTLL